MAVGLNPSNITYSSSVTGPAIQVQWGTATSGSLVWTAWDSSTKAPTSYNPNSTPPGAPEYNYVSVTVGYKWTPELYITGPLYLKSTCVMPMSF